MSVAAHDPYVAADDEAWQHAERLERGELFASCDAVSVHVPLVAETANLVDAALIGSMHRDAVLINTSRGGVVDEQALIEALREGRLGGAAVDVYAAEPVDAAAGARFADVPNLLLTPHIAGITVESDERVGEVTVRAVREALGDRT
jgi:(S)-sulfolactate dehydrogenase